MRQLTESFLGFSWALSLFGLEQGTRLPSAGCGCAPRRGAAAFDELAWETKEQLGAAFQEIWQAGDSLQRDAIDLLLPAHPCRAGDWLAAGAGVVEGSGETLRFFNPTSTGGPAWREIGNKIEVFRLVKQVGRLLGVPPPGGPFPVEELIRRSYALGDFPSLWAIEGLGHDWTESEWAAAGAPPRDLLSGERGRSLPAGSRLMLHAGLGLGIAQKLLQDLRPGSSRDDFRRTVERVIALCRANAQPDSLGAALESLGLVTRSFFPQWAHEVDRAVREADPAAAAFYWHGAGRALYFLPVNFVPWGETTWRPFAMARREAPDGLARDNAFAGLGWAFTLVNMRQPEVMARLLLSRHQDDLRSEPGFVNGVVSALVMRWDTNPGVPLIDAFLGYRPAARAAAGLWDELVREPAERALQQAYPVLRDGDRLGEIFRAHPLDLLMAGLPGV